MAERMFAPAVMFVGARVPIDDLAEHLKVYVKEWLPEGRNHETALDDAEDARVVYFPMTVAEFASWGAMLLEDLHGACHGHSEDSANEFLACYADYAPGGKLGDCENDEGSAPARMMFATLYISDDNGLTWMDKRYLQLRRPGA